ncbi:DUF3613 domain-containing protein [Pseudomonadota bacterium AL_CKDN230030165-1A_HGKHYDSX7]
MHRSPLRLATALASMLISGTAFAQLRPPLTAPAQAAPPAASATAPVAQASPVPATPAPAAATPGAADTNAAVRQVPSPEAPPAAPAARAGADDLDRPGAVTRALMAAQADGRRAGPGVPLQGPVASAAWRRYIQSFEQPLPQWFGTRINSQSNGSGGGG